MLHEIDKLNKVLKTVVSKVDSKILESKDLSVTAVFQTNNEKDFEELTAKYREMNLVDQKETDSYKSKVFEALEIEELEFNLNKFEIVFSQDISKKGWSKFVFESTDILEDKQIKDKDITIELVGTNKQESENSQDFQKLYEEEKNKRLLMLADLDNERKRLERQREELFKMANIRIVKELFEIVDDINRAVTNNPDNDSLKMIFNKFLGTLHNYDVIPMDIKTGSDFEPSKMDALTTVKVESKDQDNKVIHIDQLGFIYKTDGSIIRPAKVVVGKFN